MQASATLLDTLKAHTDEVARLSFSPDGKTLAAHDDSTITLWDVQTGSLLHKLEEADDMFFEMSFSQDSKWIAAASDEGNARIWNVQTGELERMFSVQDERMLSLAFSPDGKTLATGSEVLSVWDVETGELMHTLSPPEDNSLSITAAMERNEYRQPGETAQVIFAHDGKVLISGCPDTSVICIWSTETWELQHTIRGHWIYLSPDEKFLAVSSNTFTVTRIYETSTWELHSTLDTQNEAEDRETFPSTFSPDGKILATHSGREIRLWDVDSGKVIKKLTDLTRKVSSPVFSPDGTVLIAGARKCGLRVWNIESGEYSFVYEPENGAREPWNSNGCRGGPPAFETLFADGGAKVAVAFPDGSVKIWDVKWKPT